MNLNLKVLSKFLIALLTGSQVLAESKIKKFLLANPSVLNFQLRDTLSRRCSVYSREPEQCQRAAAEAVRILDIAPILVTNEGAQDEKYIVSFKKQLDDFLDPMIQKFLKDLEKKLDQLENETTVYQFVAPHLIKPLDIGTLALQHFVSKRRAYEVLAVYLQDIAPGSTQVRYLDSKHGQSSEVMRLFKIISQISRLPISKNQGILRIHGQRFMNNKVYHQLVPAYLSSELKMKGLSNRSSFSTAYFLNYIYEITEVTSTLSAFLREPHSIGSDEAFNDIYSGEVGALMGIDQPPSLDQYPQSRERMKSSPMLYIAQLIRSRVQE